MNLNLPRSRPSGPWLGLVLALLAPLAAAQSTDTRLPLAHPRTTEFANGLLAGWYAPRSRQVAADAEALDAAARRACAPGGKAQPAREAWSRLALDWTELSAVAVGPLLSRHTETRIDFHPLRPAALDKVIATPRAPGQWDMDRVGAQARGLQAVEWLLWKAPAAPGSPACAYLQALTADIRDETAGVAADFALLAGTPRNDAQAADFFNEYVNQWLSGMARMRWRDLELPVRSWGLGQAPRAVSGLTARAWAVHWGALKAQSLPSDAPWKSLTDLLRQRGLADSADTMERDLGRADALMQGLTPATPAEALLAAAKQVDAITHTISQDVSGRMQLVLEFNADDGD